LFRFEALTKRNIIEDEESDATRKQLSKKRFI
jgi:hypothetical protein